MNKSYSIKELATALAKAQGKIKGAIKDSENPFFKSSYADLAAVWEACREALSENGLSIIQMPQYYSDGLVGLDTVLLHSSGEWIAGSMIMKPVKDDPQGWGSCITYFRRYGLAAMAGIAQVDDDGNEASGKPKVGTKEAQKEVARTTLDELKAQSEARKQADLKPKPPSKDGESVILGTVSKITSTDDKGEPLKTVKGAQYIRFNLESGHSVETIFVYDKDLWDGVAARLKKEVRCIVKSERGFKNLVSIEDEQGKVTDSDIPF